METFFCFSEKNLFSKLTFDQLSPIWGWKRSFKTGVVTTLFKTGLSINSPQSGDGNFYSQRRLTQPLYILCFRSTLPNLGMETLTSFMMKNLKKLRFRSTLPNLGMETTKRSFIMPWDNIAPGFRSTLPNLGMETSLLCGGVRNHRFDDFAFDQLSPIWGWKPLVYQFRWICILQLSINSPQSGDGNLPVSLLIQARWSQLSINSPQSGDGNLW